MNSISQTHASPKVWRRYKIKIPVETIKKVADNCDIDKDGYVSLAEIITKGQKTKEMIKEKKV